jgi:hypothetical protein
MRLDVGSGHSLRAVREKRRTDYAVYTLWWIDTSELVGFQGERVGAHAEYAMRELRVH